MSRKRARTMETSGQRSSSRSASHTSGRCGQCSCCMASGKLDTENPSHSPPLTFHAGAATLIGDRDENQDVVSLPLQTNQERKSGDSLVNSDQHDLQTTSSHDLRRLFPLFVLCDGHGSRGGSVARLAAQSTDKIFYERLSQIVEKPSSTIDTDLSRMATDTLNFALRQSHRIVVDAAVQKALDSQSRTRAGPLGMAQKPIPQTDSSESGAVVVACVIISCCGKCENGQCGINGKARVICGSIGDARVLLVSSGALSAPAVLSAEHALTNPSERARVEAAGGNIFRRPSGIDRIRVNQTNDHTVETLQGEDVRVCGPRPCAPPNSVDSEGRPVLNVHTGSVNMTRAVGKMLFDSAGVIPEPEFAEMVVSSGDMLVLCSDGVSDVLTDDIIAKQVASSTGGPTARAHALCTAAVTMSPRADNSTAICVMLT